MKAIWKALVLMLFCSITCYGQDLLKETRIDSVSAFFNSGSAVLKNSGLIQSKLKNLDQTLKYKVKLIAYTDTVGSANYNNKLASNRLKSVTDLIDKTMMNRPVIDTLNLNENHKKNQLVREDQFRRVDIVIYKLETNFKFNTPINLHINFQSATDNLLKDSYESLNKLLFILQQDSTIRIQLGGHVCCSSNYELSLKRAERVKSFLVRNGIKESRMKCIGYDNTVKLVPETTPANQAKNRRVEVTFIK